MISPALRQRAARHPLAYFLRRWIQDPLQVGAVAPSSRGLARRMVSGLAPGATVVELGPGTGTFTTAILDCGVEPENLYMIERSDGFTSWLQDRFPGTNVVCGDAVDSSSLLSDLKGQVDFVISGLPLLLFSQAQKAQLVAGAFALLAPGGSFVQFTYGGRCPVSKSIMRELGLKATLAGLTPLNLPPAFVYRLERLAA